MTLAAAIRLDEGEHLGWRALWLRGADFALALVPEVGGRIFGLEWHGQQLAFANPDLAGRVENVAALADVRARKRALGLVLWGGDKTWLAPQAHWTDSAPFLDLDSGAYAISIEAAAVGSVAVRLTSPVCRESGMQIERRIRTAPGDPCGSRKFGADPSSTRAPATSHWDPLLCSPAVIIGASKSAGETHERRVPASGSTARRRR